MLAQDWQGWGEHSDKGNGHSADDCAGLSAAPGGACRADNSIGLPPAQESCGKLHAAPVEKVCILRLP